MDWTWININQSGFLSALLQVLGFSYLCRTSLHRQAMQTDLDDFMAETDKAEPKFLKVRFFFDFFSLPFLPESGATNSSMTNTSCFEFTQSPIVSLKVWWLTSTLTFRLHGSECLNIEVQTLTLTFKHKSLSIFLAKPSRHMILKTIRFWDHRILRLDDFGKSPCLSQILHINHKGLKWDSHLQAFHLHQMLGKRLLLQDD